MPAPPAQPSPGPETWSSATVQATFAATLVDEWVRAGLTDAVVCPGSRSTPLALALAGHGGVRVHVHHDERSGAFLALGIGLATGRPALVLTTSGTAAAELHPAVVEADLAAVPLLVCTADRPPELRDVGAPQAIDQVHLFGRSVRWYGDPGVPEAGGYRRWRALAARAHAATQVPHPGPVHLNLPFREPLVGEPGSLPPARDGGPWTSAPALFDTGLTGAARPAGAGTTGTARPAAPSGPGAAGRPADVIPASSGAGGAGAADVAVAGPGLGTAGGGSSVAGGGAVTVPSALAEVTAALAGRRGLLVAGAVAGDGAVVHAAAAAAGWPVVADPRSPAWRAAPGLVEHLDAVLRSPTAAERLRPEVIVRLGPPGSSRVVNEWLAASGAHEVVAGAPAWSDPSATAAVVLPGDPGPFLDALVLAVADRPADPSWARAWRVAADAARSALADLLGGAGPAPQGEPAIARAVAGAVPAGGHLVVSSSMPIRDIERYARAPAVGEAPTVHANRGANGIDGVVSTAVGVAVGSGGPTVLLVGDVAFLHDGNGLLGAARRPADLVCVVVDNDGGGIFSFLPQAGALPPERFEALFGTPHGLDLVALAAAHGVQARRLGPGDDVGEAVASAAAAGGVHVLVVATDRGANVVDHRRLDEAVAAAVEQALATGGAGAGSGAS